MSTEVKRDNELSYGKALTGGNIAEHEWLIQLIDTKKAPNTWELLIYVDFELLY